MSTAFFSGVGVGPARRRAVAFTEVRARSRAVARVVASSAVFDSASASASAVTDGVGVGDDARPASPRSCGRPSDSNRMGGGERYVSSGLHGHQCVGTLMAFRISLS